MRILHIQKVKGIGGSERHLLTLLPALSAAGDDVRLVVLAPGEEEGRFLSAARDAGVETVTISVGNDLDPRPVAAIAREIRRYKPDVVHTHLVHADMWGQLAARRRGVTGVRTFHNVAAFYRREPYRSAGRVAGRLAAATIAISHYVGDYVRGLGLSPVHRVRIVPYGIDPSIWTPTAEQRTAARERLGIERDRVVVGMAARMIPGKGHRLAIDALSRTQTPRLRLLIAGDGELRGEIDTLARATDGRAQLVGHLDDVRGFLAACDMLLFPTLPALGEGFGLAALEAMAIGRPVIATAVGALPEVVEDQRTGLVVAPEAGPVADALDRLAADASLRERMGAAGLARATDRFSLEAMVESTRAVYRERAT
jgi:glycosyltransferase involved in cell wall biosynthesis